ncbi:MAG: hypothetical protein ACYS9T_02885 [Planctomycetota bacterium]
MISVLVAVPVVGLAGKPVAAEYSKRSPPQQVSWPGVVTLGAGPFRTVIVEKMRKAAGS